MILVTGGCSFSDVSSSYTTWPTWLQQRLNLADTQHHATGIGAVGNGIISRQILFKVQELLKNGTTPEEILVGIMWSGCDRHEIYKSKRILFKENIDYWAENPVHMPKNDTGSWIVLAHHWKHVFNKPYYKIAYDDIYSIIQSLEHVLRVQNFLEKHNIKYFMSTYMDKKVSLGLGRTDKPVVEAMIEMIDWDKFLPVDGEYEWCKEYCYWEPEDKNDQHPPSYQHMEFVDNIILPYVKDMLGTLPK